MAETYNIPRDSSIQELIEVGRQRNAYLALLTANSSGSTVMDYATIQKLVQQGLASQVFAIGDQINVKWTDAVANETYEWPFNVVSFEDVELQDGEIVPGMYLQAHYCNPFNFQFDQSEALYYCEDALPAGTYYFTIGTTWGTNCVANTTYYFTTTKAIPAGGQIRIGRAGESNFWGAPDQAPSTWVAYTYESPSAMTVLDSALPLAEWSEDIGGTSLGTTTSAIKYGNSGINNLQRAAYGYNRWSQSGIRQYLNSDAAIGAWWTPQNNFDRPPALLATYPGFMSGFEEDFLKIIKPVKVTTALNTVSDSDIGSQEDTYDTFFLASLEQQFIAPQAAAGVEGKAWPYWKRVTGSQTEIPRNNVAGTFPVTYAINGKTSPQNVRLRSANRYYASSTWRISSLGEVSNSGASSASRFAPACVVC